MTLPLLLAWWNLIYLLPFGLAVAYLGIYVFTGITFGDHDLGGEIGDHDISTGELGGDTVHVEAHVVGGDVDADADLDADHDLATDADADADTESSAPLALPGSTTVALAHTVAASHADHAAEPSHFFAFLSLLGVGKIPLSLLLMILLLLWGSIGFLTNQSLLHLTQNDFLLPLISLPITATISLTLTSLLARLIGKFLPSMETYAKERSDLVGQIGETIYDINDSTGMVSVRVPGGDLYQVPARTRDDAPPIPKNTRVVLFDYDSTKGVFRVAPFNPAA